MANKLALGLVIGGAVSSTVGSAFKDVEGRIKKLEATGAKARVMQRQIGDTIRLRNEWKKAHDSGAAGASMLLTRLNSNLDSLRKQGVEVGRLDRAYHALGRTARSAELKAKGHTQFNEGRAGMKSTLGKAAIGIAAVAVPTKISADYQAQIRQMAIWAHTAGTDAEKQMADKITQVATQKGMSQKALASAVSGLIEKGISWEESVDYAPLIADLVDGQGMEAETIATLFSAFKEAGVAKEDMGAMLGQVAAAGDIGAFGPKDMAKYMPALLGTIKRLGMEGPEAVRFLGASLQSQFSQTQDAAAAATNMDNLLNAVISSTSQKRFAMAGYDLTGSILAATKSGKAANPVEAFIMLSEKLIARQDPEQAKRVEALKAKILASKDGSAEEEQAMVSLIEAAGLASIVSDKSASAGLLAQIKYGKTIKQNMSDIKDTDGQAKIEKDAADARATSAAKWGSATASIEASMTSIGDALRPLTDLAADGLTKIGTSISGLAGEFPKVISGTTLAVSAIGMVATAFSAFKMGKGLINIARGALGGRDSNAVQKVFVTNAEEGGDSAPDTKGSKVLALAEIGLKALGGKKDGGSEEGEGKGFNPVDVGLKVLDVFREASTGEGDGEDSGPQKVFVVNAAAIGGYGGGGGAGRRGGRRSRTGNRSGRRRAGGGPRPPNPPRPPAPPVPPGRAARAMSLVGKAGKVIPGSALLEGGMRVLDTFQNADTQEAKAEGYGAAAGNMAGALAGAAAGAAIGSVVPVLGTAIGGVIGGILGSMGGESIGASLGKSWFGSADQKPPVPTVNGQAFDPCLTRGLPGATNMGDVVRSFSSASPTGPLAMPPKIEPVLKVEPPKIDQKIDINAPLQITVKGDVKDPAALARELQPHLQRQMEQIGRQMSSRNLYDAPHVG
ncbi:phage tail tape measure protein [Pseudomonas sp. CCI3.1]|uniref:phage tail tape measure protein n=1 Tax=Pseudomonas sp. CCI3.1 TaxID=3048618 RepID=UPI002AB339CA|nr:MULTISPECIES: phage tail tape measure protein [unclassified Pseudomonas]MDY7584353.1 phage tail tape measure protein [Pseudomonas sp. CCI3.1]MEB0065555.1 phage tail tape measure protein [Pseudomonas sp. CCI3.1]MEB0071163.1 phage tail tape measure protein [Pseudomonas sp. CCI1.4]